MRAITWILCILLLPIAAIVTIVVYKRKAGLPRFVLPGNGAGANAATKATFTPSQQGNAPQPNPVVVAASAAAAVAATGAKVAGVIGALGGPTGETVAVETAAATSSTEAGGAAAVGSEAAVPAAIPIIGAAIAIASVGTIIYSVVGAKSLDELRAEAVANGDAAMKQAAADAYNRALAAGPVGSDAYNSVVNSAFNVKPDLDPSLVGTAVLVRTPGGGLTRTVREL